MEAVDRLTGRLDVGGNRDHAAGQPVTKGIIYRYQVG